MLSQSAQTTSWQSLLPKGSEHPTLQQLSVGIYNIPVIRSQKVAILESLSAY